MRKHDPFLAQCKKFKLFVAHTRIQVTMLCYVILCCAMPCHIVLCCTMLCHIMHISCAMVWSGMICWWYAYAAIEKPQIYSNIIIKSVYSG